MKDYFPGEKLLYDWPKYIKPNKIKPVGSTTKPKDTYLTKEQMEEALSKWLKKEGIVREEVTENKKKAFNRYIRSILRKKRSNNV